MLRLRKSWPFLNGLRVWLAVALLAIAAVLLYTNLASAQQSSTERTRSAPVLEHAVSRRGLSRVKSRCGDRRAAL